jgi:hypothetical protein
MGPKAAFGGLFDLVSLSVYIYIYIYMYTYIS